MKHKSISVVQTREDNGTSELLIRTWPLNKKNSKKAEALFSERASKILFWNGVENAAELAEAQANGYASNGPESVRITESTIEIEDGDCEVFSTEI